MTSGASEGVDDEVLVGRVREDAGRQHLRRTGAVGKVALDELAECGLVVGTRRAIRIGGVDQLAEVVVPADLQPVALVGREAVVVLCPPRRRSGRPGNCPARSRQGGSAWTRPSTWRSGWASSARAGTRLRTQAPAAITRRSASYGRPRCSDSDPVGAQRLPVQDRLPEAQVRSVGARGVEVSLHRRLREEKAAIGLEHGLRGRLDVPKRVAALEVSRIEDLVREIVELRRLERAEKRLAIVGPALQGAGRDRGAPVRCVPRARATARRRVAAAARTTDARGRPAG